ncbi:E3 ubiquitin-protein ligase MYLIP isoform X2 [Phlebotomus argentipes]|uniref:E3 ubiquitin-protein ligase MYLIP isoform X2 n=1 Tax=Phlebotomus argentipes TaxID=94469 RepID=UPI002892C96D|nr:E3 ubiquitin-protein ligase MYLIP isoform X2 [Phlebotomus argentipes]
MLVKWSQLYVVHEFHHYLPERVWRDLGIVCETEYFGLLVHNRRASVATIDASGQIPGSPVDGESRNRHWINLRNPLGRHSIEGNLHSLALRVKFWVPVHIILQESVRNLFYMQARQDLLENRLLASNWSNAALLAALFAQADGVKYTEVAQASRGVAQMGGERKEQQRRGSKRKCSETPDVVTQAKRCDSQTPYEVYYSIRPLVESQQMPRDFAAMIRQEHAKLAKLSAKSAKYWLLAEISKLEGFGEEIFHVPKSEFGTQMQMDIAVGPHGLVIYTVGNEKREIPYSAVESVKSKGRSFRLRYLSHDHTSTELDLKMPCHRTAHGLYRAITEKHAFYSCETVGSAVQTQFIRDLKGTIVSMFNEDTELGKRYVFDIQRTCREVYDNARRVLHSQGVDVGCVEDEESQPDDLDSRLRAVATDVSAVLAEQEAKRGQMEKMVSDRISEAFTCRVCMDKAIDTMFAPCGHVACCRICAEMCDGCPLCRSTIDRINRIFLPAELRPSA